MRPFIAEWPGSPTCLHNRARSEPCPACAVLAGLPGAMTPQTAVLAAGTPEGERPRGFDMAAFASRLLAGPRKEQP